jgi:hypothetical protein
MLFNPPWMWHEIRNCDGFNVGVATREVHPIWILRNNWIFTVLQEWVVTPKVAPTMIPKELKMMRVISSKLSMKVFEIYYGVFTIRVQLSPFSKLSLNCFVR